jgi:hypothetical protein
MTPDRWFANRGEILLFVTAVSSLLVAIIAETGIPNIPPWLVPAMLGGGLGAGMSLGLQVFIRKNRPTSNPLEFVGTELLSDDREQTVYKRKLYVTLRNASDNAVTVGPLTAWAEGDLPVNTIAEHVWQAEGPRGWRNKDWSKEAIAVRVEPGKRARTWVGLPNDAKKSDVDRYMGRAGALETIVAQGANDVTIRV